MVTQVGGHIHCEAVNQDDTFSQFFNVFLNLPRVPYFTVPSIRFHFNHAEGSFSVHILYGFLKVAVSCASLRGDKTELIQR